MVIKIGMERETVSHPDFEKFGSSEDRLIEECAELIKAITKAKRFGWTNWHPDTPEIINAKQVLNEIEDVEKVINTFKPFLELLIVKPNAK